MRLFSSYFTKYIGSRSVCEMRKNWEKKLRFLATIVFILLSTPFFITVLFYNQLALAPGNRFMQRNRALFATLSVSLWIPFLGLNVCTQISEKLLRPRMHPALFLVTHQSFSDALILALVFWMFRHRLGPGVALYKRELAGVPILGQLQKYSGNIPLARSGDVEAAKRSLAVAARRSREGYHVSGFPEGSRRRTVSTGKKDQLFPLKKGFFHLINDLKSDVEVFVVVLKGSLRSWPVGNIVPDPGNLVTVRVSDPVLVSQGTDVEKLREHMTEKMGDEIEALYSSDEGGRVSFARVLGFETILSVVPVVGVIISFFM